MRAEITFAALLAASIGLKAGLNDYGVDQDYGRLTADIAKRLTFGGFHYRRVSLPGRPAHFLAHRGACSIFVQSAYGPASLAGAYVRDAASVGMPFYRIGDIVYPSPPSARIWLGDMAQYTLGRFGVITDRAAPLVIARSAACHDDEPDLSGLRLHLTKSGSHKG